MTLDTDTPFSRAIEEHLALKQQNADLDGRMPIDRYAVEDPFENHPLFKSEEQARLEETLETVVADETYEVDRRDEAEQPAEAVPVAAGRSALPWPGEPGSEGPALDDSLWARSRDFDWGD